jgi:hypothetical protein
MKTGPVRDAQQTKQCVYNIPCDCGRCYNEETSRPLEVRNKERKYIMTEGLIEKKITQYSYEETHRICWKGAKVLQVEPNTTYTKYKESVHVSLVDHPISQASLDISHLDSNYRIRSQKTVTPFIVDYLGKLCFYIGIIQRICLFSDDFYSDSCLV